MGFGLLAYSQTTGGAVTDSGMTAVTDQDFSQRNSHYIFSAPYSLLAQAYFGASGTRVNIVPPTWQAFGRENVWPLNLSATIPSPPQVQWYIERPLPLPTQEEYIVQNTSTASEVDTYFMWIADPQWNRNLPQGGLPLTTRFTATITGVAAAWASPGALTFEQTLRGGVWAVIGGNVQGTNLLAWRLVFPRYKLYNGVRMRPGWLAQNAIGDLREARMQVAPYSFGEWGRFATWEQPQLEIFKTAATSTTIEGRLDMVYLGSDDALLSQGMGGAGSTGMAGIQGLPL